VTTDPRRAVELVLRGLRAVEADRG
jgi:hypothetical protein